jgi:hypothetical protein
LGKIPESIKYKARKVIKRKPMANPRPRIIPIKKLMVNNWVGLARK